MQAIDPLEKARALDVSWVPKVLAELNGQYVKVVRVEGEYVWHHHAEEDELFWVLEGTIDIQFRDRTVTLPAGSLCVVPKGVEHRPVASAPARVLLFEPVATRSTGNVDHAFTVEPDDLETM